MIVTKIRTHMTINENRTKKLCKYLRQELNIIYYNPGKLRRGSVIKITRSNSSGNT